MTKIQIDSVQKKLLEEILGQKIYIRNSFEQNQNEIQMQTEQGLVNAKNYLERNRLGQTLSIFDENRIFGTVVELGQYLQMSQTPRRIECYDISHIQGKFVYGSMVTFLDGRPIIKFYRLFKCKNQNNDFENHADVMRRRLQRGVDYENAEVKNPKDKGWELPDLIIVDGGKGQLSSDYKVLQEFGLESKITMVSIAKREEEIFMTQNAGFENYIKGEQGGLLLQGDSKFLCQRIRDEAHRFAIKNNRNARINSIKDNSFSEIVGIGQKTIDKLISTFGSTQNTIQNVIQNPEIVIELVGQNVYQKLKDKFYL
jgi:excinuclease ABC subunit C